MKTRQVSCETTSFAPSGSIDLYMQEKASA